MWCSQILNFWGKKLHIFVIFSISSVYWYSCSWSSSTKLFYYLLNSKNKINEIKDIKIIFLLFLSLYFALNALIQINDSLRYSPLFFFRFVLFSMSTVFIFNLINKKKGNYFKHKLLNTIIFFTIIILIDSVIQYFFGKNMFGYEIIGNRISSFLRELILGSFLTRILPILIYLIILFDYDLKKNYLFFLSFFILYFFSIYISAGRTSFTMMLIFVLLSIIFTKKLRKIFTLSLSYLIVIIIITSIFELVNKSIQ